MNVEFQKVEKGVGDFWDGAIDIFAHNGKRC